MKRYYLTETLPENKNTKDLPPDIKQKLEAYKDAKREISNAAPKFVLTRWKYMRLKRILKYVSLQMV